MVDVKNKRVVLGMSGGVDSSVCAALLKEQGAQVIGLFMDNWPREEGCGAHEDFFDVERVCRRLDIPYYRVDFSRQYREEVFSPFLEDYKRGFTPNPDVACNREIKFKLFFRKALALGAHYMATGHYARREYRDGSLKLLKGIDTGKDQTYFLHALKESHLERVLFPLGYLTKPKVRALAKKWKLATAEKKDSTGICFIGKRNFREFLSKYIPPTEGPLLNLDGHLVGRHMGQAYYTLGQRRGLALGGPGAPWFVVDKDATTNRVFVERGENHPALFAHQLLAKNLEWVGHPPTLPLRCQAQARYRQRPQECRLETSGKGVSVVFDSPQRALTPGQSVVFYFGDICLGGGRIERVGSSLFKRDKSLTGERVPLKRL